MIESTLKIPVQLASTSDFPWFSLVKPQYFGGIRPAKIPQRLEMSEAQHSLPCHSGRGGGCPRLTGPGGLEHGLEVGGIHHWRLEELANSSWEFTVMAIMAIIISMKIQVFPCFVPENRSCLEQLSRSSQQTLKIYHRWTRETLLFLPSCLKTWTFLKVKITISGTKQGFPVAEEISPNWWCGCVKPSIDCSPGAPLRKLWPQQADHSKDDGPTIEAIRKMMTELGHPETWRQKLRVVHNGHVFQITGQPCDAYHIVSLCQLADFGMTEIAGWCHRLMSFP